MGKVKNKDRERQRERERSRDKKMAFVHSNELDTPSGRDELATRTSSPSLASTDSDTHDSMPPTITEHKRNRSVDQSLDKLQDSMTSDATNLLEKFRDEYDDAARVFQTNKPNVLVAGCTGAGKSTLINKVFGRTVAQTGAGVPVTQHFARYELENESVVIYDSKGLEVGDHAEFIRTTKDFLKPSNAAIEADEIVEKRSKLRASTDGSGSSSEHVDSACIHVVWYIINSAGSRFQPFEGDVCKSLFNKLPIIFILNKADLSSTPDRQGLRETIMNLNLGNCIGIIDTICTPSLSALKIPDVCPACGSDDIDIKRKRKIMECEDCHNVETLTIETGLDVLVQRTMDALPALARERFVAAQRVSMHMKNVTARKIIEEYHDMDFGKARLERQLFKVVAKMLIRLSILWEFREHGHEYGMEIAKEHMGQYTLRDRLFLMVHKQDKHQDEKLAHTTALGIMWNRCVRELYKNLFLQSFGPNGTDRSQQELALILSDSFSDLSADLIEKLGHRLEGDDELHRLLDEEFPEELEADIACAVSIPINQSLHNKMVVTRESMATGRHVSHTLDDGYRRRATDSPGGANSRHALYQTAPHRTTSLRSPPESRRNRHNNEVSPRRHDERSDLMATTGHMRAASSGPTSSNVARDDMYASMSTKHRHKHRHRDRDRDRGDRDDRESRGRGLRSSRSGTSRHSSQSGEPADVIRVGEELTSTGRRKSRAKSKHSSSSTLEDSKA